MTGEAPVGDELQRRIEELEKKTGRGGSLWDVATAFIPVWLVVTALAGFAGFTGWEYYQKSQQELAKTQRLQFEAQIAEVEARASTSSEAPKLKAELEAKQEEARLARIDADAKKREAAGTTLREKQVEADVSGKRAEAQKAWALAQAASKKYGFATLQQREARAKMLLTSINAAIVRVQGAGRSADLWSVACIDNPAAEIIGCPAKFITRRLPPIGQEAAKPAPQPDQGPAPQTASAAAPASQERFATVNTTTLNLRACPAPNCEKIVEMPMGFRAKVIGDAGNGWAQLEVTYHDGRKAKGFANAKHLQF